jgi:hypothetical protein
MKGWLLVGYTLTIIILLLAWNSRVKQLLSLRVGKKESFGSPGTYVQLATSHVPTSEDEDALQQYRRQVRHDLISMTGSA